jgi:hypothetical protein
MNNIQDDYDEELSESRKFRYQRHKDMKEFSEPKKNSSNKNTSRNPLFKLINSIEKIVFKYKFEKVLIQLVKDEKKLNQGMFNISLDESKRISERRQRNTNWIYSNRDKIKKYYPNEFIMKMVRGMGFVDSLEWYNP